MKSDKLNKISENDEQIIRNYIQNIRKLEEKLEKLEN